MRMSRAATDQTGQFYRAAEFFAGMGLVRAALEQESFKVVWANDIDRGKFELYRRNFPSGDFVLKDIENVRGWDIPDVEIATASFPCVDLSLAGGRAGLNGSRSGFFWQFTRAIEEMDLRRPPVVLLENVAGFASSRQGKDIEEAVSELNRLGYTCDILMADAKWFLPQSRARVFIIGFRGPHFREKFFPSPFRPEWLRSVFESPATKTNMLQVSMPALKPMWLSQLVERLPEDDSAWWNKQRTKAFLDSLSSLQAERLRWIKAGKELTWRTAYRRTRAGKAVWEIRSDDIAGCLRTARGGSSKQALVEAGGGEFRVRWMTPREYARLQGAGDYKFDGVRNTLVYFGFGDAVCVPVVRWIAEGVLVPLLNGECPVNPLGEAAVG
jgi:DNA (cytosine-5)-methyltransferase 1